MSGKEIDEGLKAVTEMCELADGLESKIKIAILELENLKATIARMAQSYESVKTIGSIETVINILKGEA